MYLFTRKAREQGFQTLKRGVMLLLFCGPFSYFFNLHGVGSVMSIIAWGVGIFAAFGLLSIIFGLLRVVCGGAWHIEVNNNEIIWQSPLFAEQSFRYLLSDILHIEKRIKNKKYDEGKVESKISYYLFGADGKNYWLTHQSGCDPEEAVKNLEKRGVKIQENIIWKDKTSK